MNARPPPGECHHLFACERSTSFAPASIPAASSRSADRMMRLDQADVVEQKTCCSRQPQLPAAEKLPDFRLAVRFTLSVYLDQHRGCRVRNLQRRCGP